MGVAGLIFESHPSNFGNQGIFLVSDVKKMEISSLSIYRDLHVLLLYEYISLCFSSIQHMWMRVVSSMQRMSCYDAFHGNDKNVCAMAVASWALSTQC